MNDASQKITTSSQIFDTRKTINEYMVIFKKAFDFNFNF